MSRIQIPIDILTSRFNMGERFTSLRANTIGNRFANLKPLSEFLDVKRVNKPQNFVEMQSRVNYNLGHFSSNYAVVFLMLCVYGLLTSPWLLFDIIFVTVGMFIIGKLDGQDLEFGTQRFSTVQLYTGLWVVAIPIALISGVFSLMMWLIGASGFFRGGGLGGRPRAPKSAPQWGRPSRRERRKYEARQGEDSWWGDSQRVEEVGDESDSGVGLASTNALVRRGTGGSFSSGMNITAREDGEETTDDSEDGTDDDYDDDMPMLSPAEEALAEAAMARVARAHSRGKTNVKLGKEELAAYQKKLALMEYQRTRPPRGERVAVPITALGPAARSTRRLVSGGSTPPSTSSPDLGSEREPAQPPMGYFPPPYPRSLPRSGSSASRTPSQTRVDRDRDLSPFTYSYIRKGDVDVRSTARQPSDSSDYQSISRGQHRSDSQDPFQYMTGEKQPSSHSGASASSRTLHPDPMSGAPYYGSSTVVRRRTGGHEDSASGSEDAFDPAPPGRVNSSGSTRPDPKGDDKSSPPAKKSSSSSAVPSRKKSVATRTSILGTTRRKAK
ncbi:putative prenylated rab acceptor [Triangularia setosa]|uniref:Prenylated rab acceptor n=1 Tax=Triangularia setosa TaxID=2587417 RepID=A0AAN6WFB8_9PEZI|nr:putative prenylated rab acceptor [Podospora setosa]